MSKTDNKLSGILVRSMTNIGLDGAILGFSSAVICELWSHFFKNISHYFSRLY